MKNIKLTLIITIILLVVSGILIFSPLVSGTQPTQQYNKIYLNPFYRVSMTNNVNYSFNISVNPPDKISQVISAIISYDIYLTPTVTFYMWVNGKACNNPSYQVHTTYMDAGIGRVNFDCSNIINKSGNYSIVLQPSGANTGAVNGWLDLTYMNNPSGDLKLHGTEYTFGQTGKVWLQLLDNAGETVENGVCYVDIYTPDNQEYIERATMTNMVHDGIYYYDLEIPFNPGVYPAIAQCFYEAGQSYFNFSNYSIKYGTYGSGALNDLLTTDGTFIRFSEAAINPVRNISINFTITNNSICNVSEVLLTGVSVLITARFNSVLNDDITLWIWNYSNSNWIELPNKVLEDGTWRSVSNSLNLVNITKAGLVNSTGGGIKILMNDTLLADTATSNLDIDYLQFSCDQLSNPQWQEIRGSSELHVSTEGEPYYEQNLCGEDEDVNSACSEFRFNNSYWNYTWGYVEDSLLFINQYEDDINEIEYYETPFSIDCTGLIDVVETRNNISTSILDNITISAGTKENCILGIPVIFNSTEREFSVNITLDNYMKWETERNKDYVNYFELSMSAFCQNIAIVNNNSYEIPIQEEDVSLLYRDNPIYLNCYRLTDDFYWFNTYYNDSQSIYTAGEFESYLLESRFYYPDLKDLSQIIQSIAKEQNILFNINTLCNTSDETDTSCALIKQPDINLDTQEGYIFENLTIENIFRTHLTSEYMYVTAQGVDCSAIFFINETINGTTTDISDISNYQTGTKDNCEVRIPIRFPNAEENSYIEIYMENYIYWDIYWARDNVNLWNVTISEYCENISIDRGISYNLPINQSINQYINDSEFYTCYRGLDNIYWWYFFYDNLITENFSLVGQIESYHYESEFFWPKIFNDYNTILTYKRNITQMMTLDELLNLKNNKTSAEEIWNFGSRNLTSFGFDVVNETQIAESVWSWNGLISGNLLSQLASYFWNWTGSIANNILDLFKISIWNSPDRNLTYYNNSQQVDLTNYSKISEFVWNNTDRNLTYFPTFPIQSDLTNYSLIAEQVWYFGDRNLTFYNNSQQVDLTNYTYIMESIWNYSYRNLTYFPTQQDLTNYTFVIEGVWNYMNRSLSDYNQSDLTNYTKITEDVWNYFNRTLTDYNSTSQLDLTNYTKITNDVWNYIARNLTYYPDMTNYTKISYGVWTWYNRTLFYNVTGEETSSTGYGKLPLSTINIITPDPFYFDVDYQLIYDPVDIKGKTVEITKFSVKLLENITYELNNPVIMADGRYKQTIKIPLQDIDTFTLSVNATQRYVNSNQKFYINVERQRGGITGFTISDTGKRNLMYLGFILLFFIFLIMILAVVNKRRRSHSK